MKGKIKIFVAMSGGVDSSVAALLLERATPNNFLKLFGRPTPKGFRGYDVVGVYMKGWSLTGCAEDDARDARRVAGALNIPFYVFDFEEEYKKSVVDYMISGYASGITPNPDVMCNREIKFGLFLKKALQLGADYVATGHYVQLTHNTQHTTHNTQHNLIYMAVRISGVIIPDGKRIEASLTYIYGIGFATARKILSVNKIDPNIRTKNLTEEQVNRLRVAIEKQYRIEGDLRREVASNIKRLKEIGSYRGKRHSLGLPTRGQTTKNNSRTMRGNIRRTMGSGRKPAAQKT